MNPVRVLFWGCVYLGRFHCRGTFMSRLLCSHKTSNNALYDPASLHQTGWKVKKKKKKEKKKPCSLKQSFLWLTFDLTTKGDIYSHNNPSARSQHFPTLGSNDAFKLKVVPTQKLLKVNIWINWQDHIKSQLVNRTGGKRRSAPSGNAEWPSGNEIYFF